MKLSGRSKFTLCVIAFGAYMAFSAGQDAALDEMAAPRVGMSYERFEHICGDDSLLRRKEVIKGDIQVTLRQDDFLRCLNDKLTKEQSRATINHHNGD